ncbi:MAG TPA: aminopeptidase [Bryobacteraceae bacterium]|jgi:leucyl aminopeptidase (aminopeptidase T)|nr:aminopeptidase [Bryobacteraceae bacterium]
MTDSKELLRAAPFDADLDPGARNAVGACLRIQPDEKVTLITDRACLDTGASLAHELDRVQVEYNAWILEELAPRPLTDMPRAILDDMESSAVSIFAVKAQPNELRTRMQMTDVVNRRKMRHAHMVNIDRRIMLEGMRADYGEVDRISTQVWQMASAAGEIRASTPAGTDIRGRFSPKLRWLKTSGIISPNKWGNLPGGETFTAPECVEGTFVIDGVVGDYLCEKYGDLRNNPLTVRVEQNRLVEAHSVNKELEEDFWRYCHTDENSDRVGEFAIGTNIAVHDVIGNILQDEKIPGIHIAFGNPYAAHTGADWYSATHIDVVGRKFDIWIDGRQIMHAGEFLLDSITAPAV